MNRKIQILSLLAGLLAAAPAFADLRLIPSYMQGTVGSNVGNILIQAFPAASGTYVFSADLSGYGLVMSSAGVITGTPTVPTNGLVTVPVSITDTGNTSGAPQTVNLGVIISPLPLAITTSSLPSGISGKGFTSAVSMAATGGFQPYTWSVVLGSLNGLSLGSNGTFSGTFNAVSSATTVSATIQVSDSVSTVYRQAYNFTLYPLLQITAPSSLGFAVAGKPVAPITAVATGSTGTPSWSATGLPNGISISSSTGVISGTPLSASLSNTATITVTDPVSGQTASTQLSLPVYPVLTLNGPASFGPAVINKPFGPVQVAATGGSGSFTYSATGLPSGLTISPTTGIINGTPVGSAGSSQVTLTVTDATSNQSVSSAQLPLQVYPALQMNSPSSLPASVVNKAYSVTSFSATGGSGSYTWSATGLPSGIVISSTTGAIAGTPLAASTGSVTVTVADSTSGQTVSSSPLTLTVYPTLTIQSPTSFGPAVLGQSFGPVQVVATGGSGTYSYSATGLPFGVSIGSSTGSISGTPGSTAGPSSVTITVSDPTSGQTVTTPIIILRVYTALNLSAPASLPPAVQNQTYSVTSFGSTGGSGTYAWSATGLPSGLSINPATGAITGTPTATGSSAIVVTVQDSTSGQSASSVSLPLTVYSVVTITAPASFGPAVLGQSFGPVSVLATGGSGTYTYSATGLPQGLSINSSGVISGTPNGSAGTSTVAVTVNDPTSGQTVNKSNLSLTVYTQISLSGPAVLPFGIIGRTYSGTSLTAGGGSGTYSWSLTGSTYGLSINSSGQVSGTVSGSAGATTLTVALQDATSGQSTSKAFPITLYTYPSITGPSSLPVGITGKSYQGAVASASGGSGVYVWGQTGLPAGLSISNGGLISGNVTASPGSYPVTITLTDSTLSVSATRNLTAQVYSPVSITGPSSLPAGTYGATYSVTIQAAGGSGFYTWAASGLPGMSISSAGVISGTPNAGGTFPVSVTVADEISGQSSTQNYTLTVGYSSLTITSKTSLGTVPVNSTVAYSLTATGGLSGYSWKPSGNLPSGLSLSAAGQLSGVPNAPGNYTFGVAVTDSEPQPVTLSTNLNLGVVGFTSALTLPAGSTVATYAFTLAAAGGNGAYTFTAPSGVPAGLTLSASGLLAGQPKNAGSFSFPVSLSDSSGVQTSATFSLTVAAPAPVRIFTTSPLTAATVNVPYSLALTATGGNAPYSWSVTAGTLPAGLSLSSSGNLSGTPTTAGPFSFTVTATDGSGASASAPFSLTVAPVQLQFTNANLPSGIVNADYPQQLLSAAGGIGQITYTLVSGALPDGLSLTADGSITGVPKTATTYTFGIQAADSAGTKVTGNFTILVRPASTDLILSSSVLNFSLSSGAVTLPDAQYVTVKSSANQLSYAVSGGAPWLAVNAGSGTTPSSLQFTLTSAALALTNSPAPATVTVTCNTGSCSGSAQQIAVSLNITIPPPQLTLVSDRLSFSSDPAALQAATQNLQLRNTGGGTIAVNAAVCNATWCTAGASSGSITAGATLSIPVTANPAGLSAGYYRTTVDLSTSAGTASVPVTLLIASGGTILLAPSGSQFVMPAGGQPGNPNGSFLIAVSGQSSVSWTAAVQPGANWLQLNSSSGTATAATASSVGFTITAAAASLNPQAYYGTIRVTSAGAVNSPVDYQVVLNVLASNAPVNPDPQPAGILFLTSVGSTPSPQGITVYAGSGNTGSISYQASANTNSGGSWLQVSPANGSTSAANPATTQLTVSTVGLTPGVYTGGVSYSLSGAGVRTVNVTLVVQPVLSTPVPAAGLHTATPLAGGACAPTTLAPTQTGLVNNFSAPTSWPTPLAVRLYNDCGVPVTNGQITVTFSNGDPPLAMPLVDGNTALYSATWTPRNTSSQVAVTAKATAPGLQPASAAITGAVTPNKAPILAKNGTLHIFYPQVGGALAPGNVVQIYGTNLSAQTTTPASIPLPTNAGGTSVIIGGIETPLFYVGPTQIDAMIPYELTPGKQYQVIVSANGALTTPDSITLSNTAPGLAAFADGTIIAQHGDGSLVSATAPAAPGEYLVMYSSGLGLTNGSVVTGAASPSSPLATPVNPVKVTIDGASANVAFAGLTPGLVGLYQINFQVPSNARTGTLPMVVTQNGAQANATSLPVSK